MSRLQWSEISSFLNWIQSYQQQSGNIFTTKQFRSAFNLGVSDAYARLRRLTIFGVIKPSATEYAHYEIIEINPQKIQEIKNSYVPKGAIHELYEFGGEKMTLKEIHTKFKPPVNLARFSERIARGWPIRRALSQPPIQRNRGK